MVKKVEGPGAGAHVPSEHKGKDKPSSMQKEADKVDAVMQRVTLSPESKKDMDLKNHVQFPAPKHTLWHEKK